MKRITLPILMALWLINGFILSPEYIYILSWTSGMIFLNLFVSRFSFRVSHYWVLDLDNLPTPTPNRKKCFFLYMCIHIAGAVFATISLLNQGFLWGILLTIVTTFVAWNVMRTYFPKP